MRGELAILGEGRSSTYGCTVCNHSSISVHSISIRPTDKILQAFGSNLFNQCKFDRQHLSPQKNGVFPKETFQPFCFPRNERCWKVVNNKIVTLQQL